MANRRYSPVRIANPSTENHLVPIHPNQDFCIQLSSSYAVVDIDWHSKYFEMSTEERLPNGSRTITFKQTYDLTHWGRVSNLFLGEIIVMGETSVASLCVVLQSSNKIKSNLLTVVNPLGDEVKIEAHQIVEMVIHDPSQDTDQIKCSFLPGKEDLKYEQIGYETIESVSDMINGQHPIGNIDDIYCLFPRALHSYACREHHFWFRVDADSVTLLSAMKDGLYSGGRIAVEGQNKAGRATFLSSLNVCINIRQKNRGHCFKALLLPNRKSGFSISAFMETLPCQPTRTNYHRQKSYRKKMGPQQQEISLNKLKSKLGNGCLVRYWRKKTNSLLKQS